MTDHKILNKPPHRRLGEMLVKERVITPSQLEMALAIQQQTGDRLGQILINYGFCHSLDLVEFLSRQLHLPVVNLREYEIPRQTVHLIDEAFARKHLVIPFAIDGNTLWLAMADPLDQAAKEKVQSSTGYKVKVAVTGYRDICYTLEKVYRADYLYQSTSRLRKERPEESAHVTFSRAQVAGFVLFIVGSAAAIAWNFLLYFIAINAIFTLFYFIFAAYKFILISNALEHDLEIKVSLEEISKLDPHQLPIYTILIPLYQEAEVLPALVKAIDQLDYPKGKMEVKLLLEEDDKETIATAKELGLPPFYNLVIIPHAPPKTKPKACNYGLIQARGEYTVIYDAEDLPEPDQLKKAIVAFQKVGSEVACVQAKLSYYNWDQNLLTRWFTSEYAMWFDLFLPGLHAADCPIPLGGTSNHFLTERLKEIAAWDPYNVTEDADLGVRLHRRGYRTAIMDSTTYEEANSDFTNWMKQRSRWIKGYMQTWLVHMRNPFKLYRSLGLRSFLGFQIMIGGTPLSTVINPVYWSLTTLWFMTQWNVIQALFPPAVYYAGMVSFLAGNFVFTYANMVGSLHRKEYSLVKYATLTPFYLVMMSVAAWKALIQLFSLPSFWEKTVHGLYEEPVSDNTNR